MCLAHFAQLNVLDVYVLVGGKRRPWTHSQPLFLIPRIILFICDVHEIDKFPKEEVDQETK